MRELDELKELFQDRDNLKEIANIKIEQLHFGNRVLNILKSKNINTLQDLLATPIENIMNIRKTGNKSSDEIEDVLYELNLNPDKIMNSEKCTNKAFDDVYSLRLSLKTIAALAKANITTLCDLYHLSDYDRIKKIAGIYYTNNFLLQNYEPILKEVEEYLDDRRIRYSGFEVDMNTPIYDLDMEISMIRRITAKGFDFIKDIFELKNDVLQVSENITIGELYCVMSNYTTDLNQNILIPMGNKINVMFNSNAFDYKNSLYNFELKEELTRFKKLLKEKDLIEQEKELNEQKTNASASKITYFLAKRQEEVTMKKVLK